MSISRRELYAHGEPFGDSATRRKLGGGYVCGFGGGSSSASTQETNNFDQRNAVQDGIALSGSSGNAVTLNVTDGGIVTKALDSINLNNATNAEGFESLLSAAESLWQRGEKLIGQTQQSVADAYMTAQPEAKGTLDNRTIAVIAVAGAAALAFASRRK